MIILGKNHYKMLDMVNNSGNVFLYLLLFLLFYPFATALTFNFPSFPNGMTNISLEGEAYIDTQLIRLTRSPGETGNVGRATYREPFLLKENATGKLADFTTNFTFIIDSGSADGMVFFVATNGSLLNSAAGSGAKLGLPVEDLPGDISRAQYPFVAVEFDIFKNTAPTIRDPDGDHVGIDINSLKSNITTPWNGGIEEGKRNSAWISYNSSSKNLTVSFTSFRNNTNDTQVDVISYLSYTVDLKQYLPDWVIVGFSAATGNEVAAHKVVSWNFTSTALVDLDETDNTPLIPAPSPGVQPKSGNANSGLLIGLGVVGSLILVGGLGLVWFILLQEEEGS